MRLSQFTTEDGTKNWGIDTSTVANYDHLLAAYGSYVYCQGDSEETIQKRARVDGALVWQKDFFTDGSLNQKILVDNQGNIYTSKNGNVYKYNSDGDLVWTCDVIAADATDMFLKDCMVDGSKILVIKNGGGYAYVINSSGVVALTITDADIDAYYTYKFKFDSTGDIIIKVSVAMAGYIRKYDVDDGSVLWTSGSVASYPTVDTSDNIWAINADGKLVKIGKNTGNVLVASADVMTADVQELLPVSNGNIIVVSYNSGTDVLTIDIRDENAIQLDSETHADITEYNSAVITV